MEKAARSRWCPESRPRGHGIVHIIIHALCCCYLLARSCGWLTDLLYLIAWFAMGTYKMTKTAVPPCIDITCHVLSVIDITAVSLSQLWTITTSSCSSLAWLGFFEILQCCNIRLRHSRNLCSVQKLFSSAIMNRLKAASLSQNDSKKRFCSPVTPIHGLCRIF